MIELPYTKIVNNESETSQLAFELTKIFTLGDIVCLNGNLGSGKTFFVKQFCKNFNIENVNSPSFAIVNEYIGNIKIIHFDFYRIKKVEELYDIGFDDYLLQNDSIIFIEWANLFEDVLPKKYYEIKIDLINQEQRKFTIKKNG